MTWKWTHSAEFYERVERLNLHGLHFQHITLCERRAWLYLHNINFAQWYDRVETGRAKHESSYSRDKSVNGLFGLSPDRIDWENRIVYENKGSDGAEEASGNQTAFYALMLSISTGYEWQAVTSILSSRRNRTVNLDACRLEKLWQASEKLEALYKMQRVPPATQTALCKTCSPAGFCGFD